MTATPSNSKLLRRPHLNPHKATLAALAFLIAGCASKPPIYESWVLPPIDQVTTRSTGDTLISSGYGQIAPEIEITSDSQIGNKPLPKGFYPFSDENDKGIWFYKEKGEYYFYLNKSNNLLCMDSKDCTKVEFKLGKAPVLGTSQADDFQQTLLYNGKIGNRITLAYREFKDNMARPAFNNTVEYDLSESTTVGYKGARIDVIKATNTEITYRIISGFQR